VDFWGFGWGVCGGLLDVVVGWFRCCGGRGDLRGVQGVWGGVGGLGTGQERLRRVARSLGREKWCRFGWRPRTGLLRLLVCEAN
jgi:hypothetical protein